MHEDFFFKRLTELRLQMGISARDMSLSLGQSESYINRIENKKMLPSMTVFFYICDFFHITPKEFFSDEEFSLQTIQLMRDLNSLTPETIAHITALVNELIK